MLKIRTLRAPAILMLVFLLSSVSAYGTQLEPYNDTVTAKFTLIDTDDQRHSLSDYNGKVVLVNFWASWCPPCIHEMPALIKLKQTLADKPFEILTLNVDEKKYKVRKFARTIKLDLPVLLDTASATFNDWDVKTLPTSFLIDATGTIRYRVLGNPGWDTGAALDIIAQLLAETSKTKAENNVTPRNNK